MKDVKKNQSKIVTNETKKKMRESHWSAKGMPSAFKGMKHTDKAKIAQREARRLQFEKYSEEEIKQHYIKASATVRGISIKDFDGFISPRNTRIRQSEKSRTWRKRVFQKANYTCDKCNKNGGKLEAHHLDAFASFPDKRFCLNNGVCLCFNCHRKFHEIYGKGKNIITQYLEFKSNSNNLKLEDANWKSKKYNPAQPTVIIVSGVAGSGKSWVCEQLAKDFTYISYDKNKKSKHLDLIKSAPLDKLVLYDLNIKTSTFIRRNYNDLNIRFVTILGDFLQVKKQILDRGGKITKGLYSRWKVMKRRSKQYSEFFGSSSEILKYLKNINSKKGKYNDR